MWYLTNLWLILDSEWYYDITVYSDFQSEAFNRLSICDMWNQFEAERIAQSFPSEEAFRQNSSIMSQTFS